ncbi:tyrosyl-tRNA synthetase [Bombardia bombarda]|uniref:Tyrosine--tRNA ligase n=1 Tax=Bombardia bombarda TaxID=252184 RepID=A0AA39XLU9_9PEZI|nr:tyrosyl-tRNA synthetase [Bombardia bombarda]
MAPSTTDETLAAAADVKLGLAANTKSVLTKEEKIALIRVNLSEILDFDIIEKIIDEGRHPRIYWGTATTGRPHCGYFVPALKIGQYLAAGCNVVILLADIHGFLDNLKAPIELVQYRAKYYQFCVTSILKAVGVSTDKLEFVLGSSYQKSPEYIMDVYKLCSVVSEHDAKKAGAEIVKQSENAPLSGLLYPILQVLDEEHLKVDAQFGGVDQRKLFTAAKEWLPKLGYRQRAHLMNPMVPGLQGSKMSSSDPDSKIDLLDSPEVVTKKIKKAEAAPGVTEGNGLLAFTEHVLLPAKTLHGGSFQVDRERDGLPPLVYTDITQMHSDYKSDVLTPQLLKPAISKGLNELMAPIQADFQASKEWQEITLKAYPPEEKPKKVKKVKDKGSRYPGGGAPPKDGAAKDGNANAILDQ